MMRASISIIMAVMLVTSIGYCSTVKTPSQPVHCLGSDAANRWCYHA